MGILSTGLYEQTFRNNVTELLAAAARVPTASVVITRIQGCVVLSCFALPAAAPSLSQT